MGAIIIQAVGLFLIILLGFLLKQVGLLTKLDGTRLSIVIVNVTLPAVVIVNLAHIAIQGELVVFILIGLFWSIFQIMIAWLVSKKQEKIQTQFFMYCASGFNIGNFTLPFVQGFLPLGVPLISMFDLGNSIMLAGGTGLMVDGFVNHTVAFEPRQILRRLLKSIPFTCYLVMLLLRIFSIDLPTSFLTMLQPVASANVFLSMFMIGLYLDLKLPKHAAKDVVKLLFLRYGVGLVLIVFFYFLPIPDVQKTVLCLLAVTPVPLFGVINSVLAGVEEETVGFASSISFLLSLPLMTILLLLLGVTF
ncbi:AEC family transporter [Enterococcus olivae]